MTHYEVFGVSREASTAQVRTAFRRLARAYHPDTSASGSVEALAPINEAWRVLGDPAACEVAGGSPADAAHGDVEPDPTPPPTLFRHRRRASRGGSSPGWLWVGIVIVLLGVFTYTPSKPGPPDNVLQVGIVCRDRRQRRCFRGQLRVDHDGVVGGLLVADQLRAVGLEPHRDSQGLGVACIHFDV